MIFFLNRKHHKTLKKYTTGVGKTRLIKQLVGDISPPNPVVVMDMVNDPAVLKMHQKAVDVVLLDLEKDCLFDPHTGRTIPVMHKKRHSYNRR